MILDMNYIYFFTKSLNFSSFNYLKNYRIKLIGMSKKYVINILPCTREDNLLEVTSSFSCRM